MKIQQIEYQQRRERIFAAMEDNSIAFIVAAPHYHRNFDNEMIYRQSSDFYYATGFPEPDAVAVLIKENGKGQFVLFSKVRDTSKEIWTGPIVGQEQACSLFGADAAYPIEDFADEMNSLLANKENVYFEFSCHPDFEALLMESINELQSKVRYMVQAPRKLLNIHKILHDLRIVKSATELELMANVGNISALAHARCMQQAKPGMYEYQLEAEFIYACMQAGCRHQAYPGIFASGANACVLHYTANDRQIKDGDLVLIDAGAEMDCYASDITRTFPINGKYSADQQALYEVILNVQKQAIAMLKPGVVREEVENFAIRGLSQGLIDLGIIKASLDNTINDKLYKNFYMHRIGHWLGIDTHDRGDYVVNGNSRPYEAGFVLTIEPGLYISPSKEVDEKWHGMGIRIEDDVAITDNGHQILTSAVPKEIKDIEALMADKA